METIAPRPSANQIVLSKHQLNRFLDFIENADTNFGEMEALFQIFWEKLPAGSQLHRLAGIGLTMTTNQQCYCIDEKDFFEKESPLAARAISNDARL